jgi:hypothetical protein
VSPFRFFARAYRSRISTESSCVRLASLCRASQKDAFARYCRNRFAMRFMGRRAGVANIHRGYYSIMSLVVRLTTSVWHDL